jgi:hypothetical protein
MLLVIQCKKARVEFPIGIFVTGINDAICCGTKNRAQVRFPVIPQRSDQRVHGVL